MRQDLEQARRDATHASQQAYEARRVAQQLKEALTKAEETTRSDRSTAETMFAKERAQAQALERRWAEEHDKCIKLDREVHNINIS